jgi:D-alanine-D-alanine ligase
LKKIRVGVLLGGASSERAISLASGLMIADHLPKDRYEVALFDTLALMARNPAIEAPLRERGLQLVNGAAEPDGDDASTRSLPEPMREQIARAERTALPATALAADGDGGGPIDVAFLALHGRFGEDGTVQGFLDLIGVPYTGSGTLSSALAMDKVMAKKVLAAEGLQTPLGVHVTRSSMSAAKLIRGLNPPFVVKPSKQGSSFGMRMVESEAELQAAVEEALRFDDEVLIEERIRGVELTVGVLGVPDHAPLGGSGDSGSFESRGNDDNDGLVLGSADLEALPVIEIVPKGDFFDYAAKYDPSQCEEICPARIAPEAARTAQEMAIRSHRALRCAGYSRTDLILGPDGPVVLEVNTLPGMTVNSLLPKAARTAGIEFPQLLDRIVRLALRR